MARLALARKPPTKPKARTTPAAGVSAVSAVQNPVLSTAAPTEPAQITPPRATGSASSRSLPTWVLPSVRSTVHVVPPTPAPTKKRQAEQRAPGPGLQSPPSKKQQTEPRVSDLLQQADKDLQQIQLCTSQIARLRKDIGVLHSAAEKPPTKPKARTTPAAGVSAVSAVQNPVLSTAAPTEPAQITPPRATGSASSRSLPTWVLPSVRSTVHVVPPTPAPTKKRQAEQRAPGPGLQSPPSKKQQTEPRVSDLLQQADKDLQQIQLCTSQIARLRKDIGVLHSAAEKPPTKPKARTTPAAGVSAVSAVQNPVLSTAAPTEPAQITPPRATGSASSRSLPTWVLPSVRSTVHVVPPTPAPTKKRQAEQRAPGPGLQSPPSKKQQTEPRVSDLLQQADKDLQQIQLCTSQIARLRKDIGVLHSAAEVTARDSDEIIRDDLLKWRQYALEASQLGDAKNDAAVSEG
eukprot:gene2962-12966_t